MAQLVEVIPCSDRALAAFLGANVNTVRRWRRGELQPGPMAARFLQLVWKLHEDGADLQVLLARDELRLPARYMAMPAA